MSKNLRKEFKKEYNLGYDSCGNRLIGVREGTHDLGHPEKEFDTIHVTGSKGSSSTCSFIHTVLKEEGYKVGLFSGSNVSERGVREKFQINDNYISEQEFLDLGKEIVDTVKTKDEWDILVLMGLKYFSDNDVDIAIFEAGIGGSGDSTNVISADLCVITNAVKTPNHPSLGKTDIDVATNKSGIIHHESVAVSNGHKEVNKHINKISNRRNVKYYEKENIIEFKRNGLTFKSIYKQNTFDTKFIASYLCENINTALTGLLNSKFEISDESIVSAVSNFTFIGRLEFVNKNKILLDCASNKLSAKELKKNLIIFDNIGDLIFTGIKKEDGWKEVIDELEPIFDKIYVPQTPNIDRLVNADEIDKYTTCTVTNSIEDAINSTNNSKITVITGSLHLISSVNEIIKK